MNRRQDVETFLAKRRIALVGASRDPRHFSRMVLKSLADRGYDVVPVNPAGGEMDGRRVWPRVQQVSPPPDAALVMTPADRSAQAVADCDAAGLKLVWLHRGAGQGSVTPQAVELAQDRGMTVIAGECPFMFLPETEFVHRFHRFGRRMLGRLPA